MRVSITNGLPTAGARRIAASAAALAALLAVPATSARADVFQVSYEAAKVQSANTANLCASLGPGTCTIGVESFDSQPSKSAFTTNFGTNGTISGSYSAVTINGADQYGGAGGTGKYPVAFGGSPYTLTLSTTLASGINYFGFWLSALDSGNQVTFSKGGTQVFAFAPADLIKALGNCSNPSTNAYCGNPNSNFTGQNSGQLYAFINFRDTNGTFDTVTFTENPSQGGYESDNHTVGYATASSGTVISVPEPSTLALLGSGLVGLAGLARRARKRA